MTTVWKSVCLVRKGYESLKMFYEYGIMLNIFFDF